MATPYKLRELKKETDDLEKLVVTTVNKHNGVQKRAAEELGISEATMSKFLRRIDYVAHTRFVPRSKLGELISNAEREAS